MKRFTISFEVSEQKLPTIVSLLSGECVNMNIAEIGRAYRKANSNSGADPSTKWATPLIADMLKAMDPGKEYNYKDPKLAKVLTDQGKAKSSMSPLLSLMQRAGRVKRVRKGTYIKV